MGRRNNAYVHFDGLRPSHPLYLLLLKDAEESHLGLGREFADFVEKNGALSARSKRPLLSERAPVKSPFSCPKSSLSIRDSGTAPQLTVMRGPPLRPERLWMALAMISLPVPVSPIRRTGLDKGGYLVDLVHHILKTEIGPHNFRSHALSKLAAQVPVVIGQGVFQPQQLEILLAVCQRDTCGLVDEGPKLTVLFGIPVLPLCPHYEGADELVLYNQSTHDDGGIGPFEVSASLPMMGSWRTSLHILTRL